MDDDLLARLERYYDEAPRANADAEEHGPFTIFVLPRRLALLRAAAARRAASDVTPDDVTVGARAPRGARAAAVDRVGARDHAVPARGRGGRRGRGRGLPAARSSLATRSRGDSPVAVRRLAPDDPDLAAVQAAIHVGFGQDDTQIGPASVAERDAWATEPDSHVETLSAMIAAGRTVTFGAFDPELGAVGGGSHNPRGDVTEIVGVAVLPAQRRRGIAGHLTWALAADAAEAGVRTVFMSAGSDDVARVYEGVGFRRVGTACIVG